MAPSRAGALFPPDWASGLGRLKGWRGPLSARWPEVTWDEVPVGPEGEPMGLLRAQSRERDHLLVFVAGLHGVEGPAGAAVIEQFLQSQAGEVDPERVSLWFVYGPNPTGWRDGRKANHRNVDLNRSFLTDRRQAPPANPGYEEFRDFLEPRRPRSLAGDLWRLAGWAARGRLGALEGAVTLGQYTSPEGLYFGGREEPEATLRLKALFDEALTGWSGVTILDLHTGYGPKDTLAVVNSRFEPVPPEVWSSRLEGALVQAADGGSFYEIHGDMTDWLTRRHQQLVPGKDFWAATLEFGTAGTSLAAQIRTLRTTIHETAAFWRGTPGQRRLWTDRLVAHYAPDSPGWRGSVADQAHRVLGAVLRARGLVTPPSGR